MGPAPRVFSVLLGVSLDGMVIWVLLGRLSEELSFWLPVFHLWLPGILIRSALGLTRN
jgi:hypothetical protein